MLKRELGGPAHRPRLASLLDPVMVEAYGYAMPINQVATVSVPEPRMLSVQVWDRSLASAVDRAIRDANLGLNPIMEGQLLRIPIPELNAERRQEMVKVAHKYAEQARVAVRHVRRDGMDRLKKRGEGRQAQPGRHASQSDKMQKLTDATIRKSTRCSPTKEAEIMQV